MIELLRLIALRRTGQLRRLRLPIRRPSSEPEDLPSAYEDPIAPLIMEVS